MKNKKPRWHERLIKNKTVAIIGGGQTIDSRALEAETIIRCNHHFTYQEGRTDILYHRLIDDLTRQLHKRPPIKFLRLSRTGPFKTEKTENWLENWLKKNGYKFSYWKWRKELPFNPFTGVFAIIEVSKLQPKEIFITGVNFYTDGVGGYSALHLLDPNIQAIIDCSKICKVVTDKTLTEFLKGQTTIDLEAVKK